MSNEKDKRHLLLGEIYKPQVAETLHQKYGKSFAPRIDTIICPKCGTAQAVYIYSDPFLAMGNFIHTCAQCQYLIMESEWNRKNAELVVDWEFKLRPGLFIEQRPNCDRLRALSWKQPYASLMLHGKIETRVWDAKYRGYVLICASKTAYTGQQIIDISGPQTPRLARIMPDKFPLGKAIAIGKLVGSRPMTKEDEDACFVEYQEPWIEPRKTKGPVSSLIEKRLWCHIYEDVHAIEPFDWKGKQGWSTLTWEDRKKIIIL